MYDDAIELSPSSDSNSSNLNSPINQHVATKRKQLNDKPTTPINSKRKKVRLVVTKITQRPDKCAKCSEVFSHDPFKCFGNGK